MPGKDGTGPRAGGGGRMGGSLAGGPGGRCVCQQCGYLVKHKTGSPCNQEICPKCGQTMVREG